MKRCTTESQIIAAIDKCYSNAQKLSEEAAKLDEIADNLFRYPEAVEGAKCKRLLAAKTRQRANNLTNKKAKKLGEKLSEFRTAPMTIIPDDSVPV